MTTIKFVVNGNSKKHYLKEDAKYLEIISTKVKKR